MTNLSALSKRLRVAQHLLERVDAARSPATVPDRRTHGRPEGRKDRLR